MSRIQADKLILANWGRRSIAWVIDYLIINIMLGAFDVETVESQLVPAFLKPTLPYWSPLSALVLFFYWTMSEWYFGRSIGQLLLNLRLVDVCGEHASLKSAAVQSIGKSLFLPLDCLIGWFYRPCRRLRQRFCNRLSHTVVIYLGKPMRTETKNGYLREA